MPHYNNPLAEELIRHYGSLDKIPATVLPVLNSIQEKFASDQKRIESLELIIQSNAVEMAEMRERLRYKKERLAKANEELDTLFTNIDTTFFSVDLAEQKVMQMSPSCEKIFGYTSEDFFSNPNLWYEVIVEEDKHLAESQYPAMHAGNKFSHTNRIRTKDGKIRWVETKITPTLGADGKVCRVDGVATDVTAQKNAEEENQQKELRFQKLIEHSHDGIALLNPEGKICYISPNVERILGYTAEELHAADAVDFMHPDEKDWVVEMLSDVMIKPGAVTKTKYRIRNKQGAWRWLNINITNLLHDKCVQAVVFNYEDITEHVEALEQIESDRRNRDALINSTSDLMWSFDANLRLLTANNSFLIAMKFVSGVDLQTGDNLLNLNFPLHTLTKWKGLYERVLSGESFIYEIFETQPYNQWAEISLHPMFENGRVIGGSCVWHDITEKKLNNEKLIASEKMMSEAQRISSFGSYEISFDAEGALVSDSLVWSSEVYRIYGYDKDLDIPTLEVNNRHIITQDRALFSDWMSALFHGDSPGSIDFRINRVDGEIRWVKTSADLIYEAGTRNRSKIVGTIQDITERKFLEKERTQVNKDLVERNKALEQFAHIVSHNLRAPVANIIGLSNLIQVSKDDIKTQFQCISGLNISAQRLDDIIKDLNKILQLKRGKTEEKDLVNLDWLVSNIKDSIQMQIKQEQVTIKTNFSQLAELYTIKNYMHSIFFNLISNSIKYKRADVEPVIEISSRQENGKMFLSFSDNCRGIDLEKHGSNVFGLYKRFHHNTEGKGLGMFMVKTQVESLGGKVAIKSEVDRGTEITIELSVA
jgi:PAS domain S-box-containing protein